MRVLRQIKKVCVCLCLLKIFGFKKKQKESGRNAVVAVGMKKKKLKIRIVRRAENSREKFDNVEEIWRIMDVEEITMMALKTKGKL
jgi:hypothetical protein